MVLLPGQELYEKQTGIFSMHQATMLICMLQVAITIQPQPVLPSAEIPATERAHGQIYRDRLIHLDKGL
jgi:hypothetical protein